MMSMTSSKKLVLPIILCVLLSACLFNAPAQPTAIQPIAQALTATLNELKGVVSAKQPAQAEFSPAQEGLVLQVYGETKTGADGRARINLSTGTFFRIGPSSYFALEKLEENNGNPFTKLKLYSGKVWVILTTGSVEVETPSGSASVQGSYLSVETMPDNKVRITCLEGDCRFVNNTGAIKLVAGQMAVIRNFDSAPETGNMSKDDFDEWLIINPEAQIIIPAVTVTQKALNKSTSDIAATPQPTITPLPLNGWVFTNGQWVQYTPTSPGGGNNGVPSSQQQPPQVVVQQPQVQVFVVPGTNFTATPDPTQTVRDCNNVLYPARPGSQWVYLVTTLTRGGYMNLRVDSVVNSQAVITTTEDGFSRQFAMTCDQDIILNYPLLSNQKMLGDALGNTTMNVDYAGGAIAPNETAFIANNWALTWSVNYFISGQGELDGPDGKYMVNVSPSPVTMTCQSLGSGSGGSVTVPAGTFTNTLKVVCVVQGQTAPVSVKQISTGKTKDVIGQVYGSSTQWFLPRFGLIKSQEGSSYILVNGATIRLPRGVIAGDLQLANYFVTP